MQPYEYQPLPSNSSIRVLILYPAADTSSTLECDLITNDRLAILRIPDNKTFDAVSYVWGNGAHDIPLYCKLEGTFLYISAVVDEMLRNLRKSHKDRRLWVDALCLNQKDNQEKSIQVQQMGQIYHMADKVHIWLGPAVESTPLAFAFLRTLVAKFVPTSDQAREPTTEEILHTFKETFQHRNFQPVLGLLQNSWFTRRWTLQEGFLARNAIVRCGGHRVPWHWFTEGLKLIQNRSQQLQDIQNDENASYALNVLKALIQPADLLSLLWTLHKSECSDPRDRIYSLLGLARKVYPKGLDAEEPPTPDYGLSADTVYRRFVCQCISTDRFLQILLHIDAFGSLSDVNPKWPSWVPNWTRARDRKLNTPTATSLTMRPSWFGNKDDLFDIYYDPGRNLGVPMINLIPPSENPDIPRDDYHFVYPTVYSNDNNHGIIICGEPFTKTIEICDQWPESNDSDHLIRYLSDWIHQKAIIYLPDQELSVEMIHRETTNRLLFLVTGSDFFGYAKHSFLKDPLDIKYCNEWLHGTNLDTHFYPYLERCQQVADLVYPIAREPPSYTLEQVHLKDHLNGRYNSNTPPTAESRQDLLDLLDDVSRMMREGSKKLIAASCDGSYEALRRRHWIAPSDVREGDVITNISHCGRIGALVRPIDSPSELNGRPVFKLIGILWSLEDVYFYKPLGAHMQPEEFLIL